MGTPTPVYLQYVTFGDDLRNDEARDKKQIEMADKKLTTTATTIASGKGGGETPAGGRRANKKGERTLTPFGKRLAGIEGGEGTPRQVEERKEKKDKKQEEKPTEKKRKREEEGELPKDWAEKITELIGQQFEKYIDQLGGAKRQLLGEGAQKEEGKKVEEEEEEGYRTTKD